MNVFKIATFLEFGNKGLFDIPVKKQKAYLKSLGEAKDDIDRSYKQFLCQNLFVPNWKKVLWFIVSVCAIPFAIVIFMTKGLFVKFERQVDTIGENRGMPEIIPVELSQRYDINFDIWNAGTGLQYKDIRFLFCSIIGWKQPYFILKMILLLAKYSPMVVKYHPKRIIEYSEYSFGSSAITDYLHYRGVKHINVQHGEKLYNIRDSFFHYDECFVWHEHYVRLLTDMKAEESQFRIAVPPSLKIDTKAHLNRSCYADYKYYLAADNEQEIKSIVEAMAFVKHEGKSVKYRIHPRYTDLDVLKKYVPEEEIELPTQVNILDSISNMEYAVGSFSTVLLQAHLSGKKVILNDVTFPKRYLQLKEYGYILAKDEFAKLSNKQKIS